MIFEEPSALFEEPPLNFHMGNQTHWLKEKHVQRSWHLH